MATKKATKKVVLVRTYSAGVHVGTLGARSETEIEISDARRIWEWRGRNTLHEIALRGPGPGSKVSEAVPSIILSGWLEIIPLHADAIVATVKAGWGT